MPARIAPATYSVSLTAKLPLTPPKWRSSANCAISAVRQVVLCNFCHVQYPDAASAGLYVSLHDPVDGKCRERGVDARPPERFSVGLKLFYRLYDLVLVGQDLCAGQTCVYWRRTILYSLEAELLKP